MGSSIYATAPVKVVVGPQRAPFYVHRSILEKSPTLRQKCAAAAAAAAAAEIALPELEPLAMDEVFAFLYTGVLHGGQRDQRAAADTAGADADSALHRRIRLYVHARLLRLDKLADAVAAGLSPRDAHAWPAVLDIGPWVCARLPDGGSSDKNGADKDAWFPRFAAECIDHASARNRCLFDSKPVLAAIQRGGPFALTLYRLLAQRMMQAHQQQCDCGRVH